jgi:hypothetical protein
MWMMLPEMFEPDFFTWLDTATAMKLGTLSGGLPLLPGRAL